MSTHELIVKINDCIYMCAVTRDKDGYEKAEKLLRRLQYLWNQERPLILHTKN